MVIPNPKTAGELPLSFRDGLIGETEIDKQKMNRLIWGDNLLAMQALLNQGYEGKINLIYIDPPFDSKADYSHRMTITSSVIPVSSVIAQAESSPPNLSNSQKNLPSSNVSPIKTPGLAAPTPTSICSTHDYNL